MIPKFNVGGRIEYLDHAPIKITTVVPRMREVKKIRENDYELMLGLNLILLENSHCRFFHTLGVLHNTEKEGVCLRRPNNISIHEG